MILFVTTLVQTKSVYAQYFLRPRNSYVSVITLYNSYEDIQLNSTGQEPSKLSPTMDVELAFRLYRVFHFTLIGQQATDSSLNSVGFGFRFDLPGVFFFGARRTHLIRRRKRDPVNTSIYGSLLKSQQQLSQTTQTSIGFKGGLTMEVFVLKDYVSLVMDVSGYTVQGNLFSSGGVGLGFQF